MKNKCYLCCKPLKKDIEVFKLKISHKINAQILDGYTPLKENLNSMSFCSDCYKSLAKDLEDILWMRMMKRFVELAAANKETYTEEELKDKYCPKLSGEAQDCRDCPECGE